MMMYTPSEEATQPGAIRPPKKRARVGRSSSVGTGTTSLLMIFTVLCFATLAMLSLSTAASNQRIQDRALQSGAAIAAAKGQAATAVAELDGQLAAMDATVSGDEYVKAAQSRAEALGWTVNTERETISLRLPAGEGTVLLTELSLNAPGTTGAAGAAGRYTVVRQLSIMEGGWQPEAGPGVWTP